MKSFISLRCEKYRMHISINDNSFFETNSEYITIKDKDEWESILHLSKSENKNYNLTGTSDFYEYYGIKEGDSIVLIPNDIANGVFYLQQDLNALDEGGKNGVRSGNVTDTENEVEALSVCSKANLSEISARISKVYSGMLSSFEKIFNDIKYLPTKEAKSSILINGFTERNQTFNFCHQYLTRYKNSFVWQEVPIWGQNWQHIDSIIIDDELKTVYYIEAKRFYGINHFEKLLDDLKRLVAHKDKIPLPSKSVDYQKVIVLLADVFYNDTKSQYCKDKKNCYDKFFNGEDVSSEKRYDGVKSKVNIVNDFKQITLDSNSVNKSICIPKDNYNCKSSQIELKADIIYTVYCGAWLI